MDYPMLPVSVSYPDLDNRIRQFLNRWIWLNDRQAAYKELSELIMDHETRQRGGRGAQAAQTMRGEGA